MSFRKFAIVSVVVAVFMTCSPANAQIPMPVMDVPAIAGIAKKVQEAIKQARDYVAKVQQYKKMIESVGEGGFKGIVTRAFGEFGIDPTKLSPKLPPQLGSIQDNIENPGAAAQATADQMYVEAGQELDAAAMDAKRAAKDAARLAAILASWSLSAKQQDMAAKNLDDDGIIAELREKSSSEAQDETTEFHANTGAMLEFVKMLANTNIITAQAVVLHSSEFLGDKNN